MTESPTSTMVLMGRLPPSIRRFPTLMGPFPWKCLGRWPIKRRGMKRLSKMSQIAWFESCSVWCEWEQPCKLLWQKTPSQKVGTMFGPMSTQGSPQVGYSWDIRDPDVGISLTRAMGCPREKLYASLFCFRQGLAGMSRIFGSGRPGSRKTFCKKTVGWFSFPLLASKISSFVI